MKKLKKGQKAIRVSINITKTLFELKKMTSEGLADWSSLIEIQNKLYELCCSVDEYSNYYIEEHDLTVLILKYGDTLHINERNFHEG